MKKISLIIICFCFKISFGQNPAKLNLKDSCIMSGGVLSIADYKKVCKVCPPGMKKVNSFTISYTINHLATDYPLKNKRWNPAFLKEPKKGIILLIEDVNGVDANGKPMNISLMVIGLK